MGIAFPYECEFEYQPALVERLMLSKDQVPIDLEHSRDHTPEQISRMSAEQKEAAIRTMRLGDLKVGMNKLHQALISKTHPTAKLEEMLCSPMFDPNATLMYPPDEPEYMQSAPVLQLVLNRAIKTNVMVDYLRHKRCALPENFIFKSGEQFTNINGDPDFLSPVFGAAFNRGWNLPELLEHPEINPNPNTMAVRFCGIEVNNESDPDPVEFVDIGWRDSGNSDREPAERRDLSPMSMMCYWLDQDIHRREEDPIGDIVVTDETRELFHTHYVACISKLIEKGALMSQRDLEICNNEPNLAHKIQQTRHAAEHALTHPSEITPHALKQFHAIGFMPHLLTQAQADEQLASRLNELRPELPEWMNAAYGPAFELLSGGWESLVRSQRDGAASKDKNGGIV